MGRPSALLGVQARLLARAPSPLSCLLLLLDLLLSPSSLADAPLFTSQNFSIAKLARALERRTRRAGLGELTLSSCSSLSLSPPSLLPLSPLSLLSLSLKGPPANLETLPSPSSSASWPTSSGASGRRRVSLAPLARRGRSRRTTLTMSRPRARARPRRARGTRTTRPPSSTLTSCDAPEVLTRTP